MPYERIGGGRGEEERRGVARSYAPLLSSYICVLMLLVYTRIYVSPDLGHRVCDASKYSYIRVLLLSSYICVFLLSSYMRPQTSATAYAMRVILQVAFQSQMCPHTAPTCIYVSSSSPPPVYVSSYYV
jgi:hypothetical protein